MYWSEAKIFSRRPQTLSWLPCPKNYILPWSLGQAGVCSPEHSCSKYVSLSCVMRPALHGPSLGPNGELGEEEALKL